MDGDDLGAGDRHEDQKAAVGGVLRCRGLEIVDDRGRVRLTVGISRDESRVAELALYTHDGGLAVLLSEADGGVGCLGLSDGIEGCVSGRWLSGRIADAPAGRADEPE